jgi:hypothetical protein
MNWPIGDGPDFQGIYDRMKREIHLFENVNKRKKTSATIISVDDPDISEILGKLLLMLLSLPFSNFILSVPGEEQYHKLKEDLDVIDSLMPVPDPNKIQVREKVFFGNKSFSQYFCFFFS